MAARDFSQDGAVGASGGAPGSVDTSTSSWTPGTDSAPVAAAQAASGGATGAAFSGYSPGGLWTPQAIAQMKAALPPGMTAPQAPTPEQQQSLNLRAWELANGKQVMFADGGAIPDDSDASDGSGAIPDGSDNSAQDQPTPDGSGSMGPSSQDVIAASLATVDRALQYGRAKYGLGDASDGSGQQQAGAIPIVPGGQSDTGIPPAAPGPGTLPPTSNPFGKRQVPPVRMSANMPAAPASQSESGVVQIPGPGTLPPTSNPFGQRQVPPPRPGYYTQDPWRNHDDAPEGPQASNTPAIPDDQEG